MFVVTHKPVLVVFVYSAGFTFARALGQAEIQGPLCQNRHARTSRCGVRGPTQGPGRWGPGAKPPAAVGFYGILSAFFSSSFFSSFFLLS